jgi:hypothetical protein
MAMPVPRKTCTANRIVARRIACKIFGKGFAAYIRFPPFVVIPENHQP